MNNKEIPFEKILDLDGIEKALRIDDTLMEEIGDHAHDSRIGTFSFKMDAGLPGSILLPIARPRGPSGACTHRPEHLRPTVPLGTRAHALDQGLALGWARA